MTARRAIRIGAAAVAIGGGIFWAFRPSPVAADFAEVQRGRLEVAVEEEGRTRVRERYVVSAPVPGRMERIELEPGDAVSARKTVVARFHPTDPALLDVRTRSELEARVRAAESAAGSARAERDRVDADLAFARSELKRFRTLVEERVLAQRELEAAERQVQSLERTRQAADFNVRTAQHQLEVARAGLTQTRGGRTAVIPLYSPIDGVILRRLQESEAVVPIGQPLLEVGRLEDLEIITDLLSSAAVKVAPGHPVSIEQWGGAGALRGRVRRIEPSGFTKISALGVEEQRVWVVIDFDEPRERWKSIGDGYRVEVRIIVWHKDDVVKVPASSLFRHDGNWAVYKVQDGVAVRQAIEVGRQNGLEAEVLNGLTAGQSIIVYPSDAIADGVKVVSR